MYTIISYIISYNIYILKYSKRVQYTVHIYFQAEGNRCHMTACLWRNWLVLTGLYGEIMSCTCLAKLPREVEDARSSSVNFHVIPRHAISPKKSPCWPRNSWLPYLSPQILEPCESASFQERNMIPITSAYCLRCLAYESTVLN